LRLQLGKDELIQSLLGLSESTAELTPMKGVWLKTLLSISLRLNMFISNQLRIRALKLFFLQALVLDSEDVHRMLICAVDHNENHRVPGIC
jgi:hypothetical protein